MSTFIPLNPPRFTYIDVPGEPEIDYKKLYELQRYISKRLLMVLLQYIEVVKSSSKNEAVNEACTEAKLSFEKLLLEI